MLWFWVHIWYFLISGIASCLPVVSCVLAHKSLIINTIHFSGLHACAGWFCLSEPLIHLILLIQMKWGDMLVCGGHIWFIVHFWYCRFFAGYFMGFEG